MGYRRDYLPVKKVRGAERNRAQLACLTAICFLFFALLINLYWPQGKNVLQRIIFPGKETAVTVLDSLADDLKSGKEIYQTLATFGKNIVQYGETD